MRTFWKWALAYAGLSIVLGLVSLMPWTNHMPASLREWFWLFTLAIPLHLAGELAGEFMWKNRAARLVEQRTADSRFSWLRIAFGLLSMLVMIGLVVGGTYVVRNAL